MGRAPRKPFSCTVVSETVTISLARRKGFSERDDFYVQCSESECQYFDTNQPPCPLNLGMFAEELEMRAARRRERLA